MQQVRLLLAMLVLHTLSINAFAQVHHDTVQLVPLTTYTITKTDGTTFIGKVLNQDAKAVMIDTRKYGVISLRKNQVRKAVAHIEPVIEPARIDSGFTPGIFIYQAIGGSLGSHSTFYFSSNIITTHNTLLTAGYYFSTRPAPAAPEGAGFEQSLTQFGIMGGRVIDFRRHRTRLLLKGGIALGEAVTPVDITDNVGYGSWFSSHPQYNFTERRQFAMSILLNPSLEIPFFMGLGVSVGAYANINYISPVFGIEGSVMIGRLRKLNAYEHKRIAAMHRSRGK